MFRSYWKRSPKEKGKEIAKKPMKGVDLTPFPIVDREISPNTDKGNITTKREKEISVKTVGKYTPKFHFTFLCDPL
jgi:hypothetical protein